MLDPVVSWNCLKSKASPSCKKSAYLSGQEKPALRLLVKIHGFHGNISIGSQTQSLVEAVIEFLPVFASDKLHAAVDDFHSFVSLLGFRVESAVRTDGYLPILLGEPLKARKNGVVVVVVALCLLYVYFCGCVVLCCGCCCSHHKICKGRKRTSRVFRNLFNCIQLALTRDRKTIKNKNT
jgi:hypothetical protein